MPNLKNCAFPDDCECAKRGYQHERDDCAVPGVVAATGTLLGSRGFPYPPRSRQIACGVGGTANLLPMTTDPGQDILDAIASSGSRKFCSFTKSEIDRIMSYDRFDGSVILHTLEEELGGKILLSWLTLIKLREGDCLMWMTMFPNRGVDPIFTATVDELTVVLDTLRVAAGAESENQRSVPAHVPTEEEIEAKLNSMD